MEAIRRRAVTYALIAVCVAIFVADAVATNGASLGSAPSTLPPLLAAMAIEPARVSEGEWWRLVTAGFVHFDLLHILFNMLALRQVGSFVEPRLGAMRFATMYAVALVAGNAAAYATTIGSAAVSAGASGAIMGAFGAMLFLALAFRVDRDAVQPAASVIALTLLNGLSHTGISNAAHAGGLVAGIAAAWIIARSSPSAWMRMVGEREAAIRAAPPPPAPARAEPGIERAWPASMPETLVIGMRRSTSAAFVLLAACCVAGVIFFAYLMFGDEPPDDPGVPLLASGLLIAAALYLGVAPLRTRLVLTRRGFVQQDAFFTRSIAWSDVERFFVAEIRARGRVMHAAAFTFVPSYVYAHPGMSWRGLRSAGTQRLAGLAREPEELATLLESWRAHWTRSPAAFAEELPRDRVSVAALLAAAIVVATVPLGAAFAATHGIGPIEELRSVFPAGRSLVRLAPRDVILRGSELPISGYTADHDREVSADLYERVFRPVRSVSYSSIVLDVQRSDTLLRSGDLSRVNCADAYGWTTAKPRAESISVPVIRVAARGCRYLFPDGSRAVAYWVIDRNVEVDVLVFIASVVMSDDAAAADGRQIARAQFDRIDRLAPPR